MSILPFRRIESFADKIRRHPFEEELQELMKEFANETPKYDPEKDQFHQHLRSVLREIRRK